MPFIRDYVVTEFAVAAASGTGEMPEHQAGDMLIVFTNKDTNSAMTEVGGNYTNISTQGGTDSMWGATWRRRATTDSEPEPSFTWSSETAIIIVIAVGNPHPSNNPTGAILAADDATIPFTQTATLSTPSANCLVLYGCSVDQVQGPTGWPTDMQVLHGGDVGAGGMGVGWMFYPNASSATDGVRFFANTADSTRIFTVCIEDDGNNSIVSPYVDQTSTAPTVLHTLSGAALTFNGNSISLPGTVARTLFGYNFTQCWSYSGTVYTDETTDMNDVGTADVTFTNTTSGIFYFGYSEPFRQMAFQVSTAGTGSPTSVWEYYNGSTWATIPGFPTQNFTATGHHVNRFNPPATWSSTSVNGVSAYYIRRRQTANWTVAAVISQGTINGMGVVYLAPGNTADSGLNPYWSSYALTGGTVSSVDQAGSEVLFGTSLDLDPGYLLTTFKFTAPRDSIDAGTYTRYKGVSVALMDSGDDYKVWTVAAKDGADTLPDGRIVIGIQPTQTTNTTWGGQGTLNSDVIDTVSLTASNAVAAVAANFSGLWFVNGSAILAGGTAASPRNFNDLTDALVRGSGLFPIVVKDGSAATFYVPLQIGGGDPAHYEVTLRTIQFPTQASSTAKTGTWHVDADTVGIEFYGQAGDTVKFISCTFTSETSYYWRFNASASASADWDFSGTTVANATVTLRAVFTFSLVTFNRCSEIVMNGADLTNCTFQNQRTGANVGAIAFTSSAEGDGVISGTFIDNNDGDLGHSIRITATGTYAFDGHTFSGGGPAAFSFHTQNDVDATDDEIDHTAHGYVDGDAIYYQDQTGSDTIGLTDGGLYYVNAVTANSLSFHTTKAAAIAGTGKVGLTDGAAGQTHYIYSAKADVYNNSGGAVTINVTNGGDTPTIRNSNGSSTTVNNSVTLEINGVVQNTQCYMITSGAVVVMNEAASEAVSGNEYKATESYNYTGATTVTVRAREMGYLPFETTGSITSAGLTVTAVWLTDPNWKLVVSGVNISFTNPTTITRASGNFTTDGWISTMSQVTVEGSAANDGTYTLSAVGTTTITITGATVTTAGAASGITLTFTRRSLT